MVNKFTALLAGLSFGAAYTIVFLLMALQSACIPIPSEIIMPFAGYKLAHDWMGLVLVATVASIASNIGSIPAYWLGAAGGRPMIERYGRYILLNRRDLDLAEKFFNRYGSITVLVGRMLPIVRTFIAFPAGIAKMNQVRFHVYTFIGSWPWCFVLAYAGMKLGNAWHTNTRLQHILHESDAAVLLLLIAGLVWFVWTHWNHRTRRSEA